MIGGREQKSRRLRIKLSHHKNKRVRVQKMMLTAVNQLSEMILEKSNTLKLPRQRAGHMMRKMRMLLKNRRNLLNSVKIDRLEFKIDKILILLTLKSLKTSILTSISL